MVTSIQERAMRVELNQAYREIRDQIALVNHLALEQDIDPAKMRYPNGMPAMVPLLQAKAELLHAMALYDTYNQR